jgi:hypothetical protein
MLQVGAIGTEEEDEDFKLGHDRFLPNDFLLLLILLLLLSWL